MNKSYLFIITLCLVGVSVFGQAKPLDEYIREATEYQTSGQFDKAIATMEQAIKEYPQNSLAYMHLGNYIGEQAQKTEEYGEIILALEDAFQMWDKAIELDEKNYEARFTRGAWGVSIPKFAGRLEEGIKDLEYMTQVFQYAPGEEAQNQLVVAYRYLGVGYQKLGALEKAKSVFEKVVEMAPETEHAAVAQRNIEHIIAFEEWQSKREQMKKPDNPEIVTLREQVEKDPNNARLLIALGKAYDAIERYGEAENVFKQAVNIDSSNAELYKLLALVSNEILMQGYDPRISMDTDFRTDLAFESIAFLDKAAALAPHDIELRLLRGISAVEMPFFVGKLEQGMKDLELVLASDAPTSAKSEALYYLGRAHQKKAMTYWIKVISEYPDAEASQSVFRELNPSVKRIDLSQYKTPFVTIDFVLGFKDELAPQTAVWVETADSAFVKTVYVSGFSGYAKGRQVNLPMWAHSSQFIDTDAITGASIDLGHHIYVWNLRNNSGKAVKAGDYVVKVEVSYWPSMQYQRVEAPITIGKQDDHVVVEEGNLIPYLEVKYVRR